jgi:hypothetical protein
MNLQHRIGVTVAMILAWAWTQEGLLLLLVAAGLYQIWEVRHQRDQGDRKGAMEYAFLIFALAWLATLPVRT